MHNSDLCSALPADEQVAVFTDKSSFIDFAYDSFLNPEKHCFSYEVTGRFLFVKSHIDSISGRLR